MDQTVQEKGQAVSEFTNTFHTLRTKLGIKDSERHIFLKYCGLYIDTSKLKWIFWTSHHWVFLIDMLLKLSRNLSTRTSGSSGLQIHNNQSMVKTDLTPSLHKISPSHRKGRVIERRKKTLKNGVISSKSHGTTLMNVAQNSHWWSRSNIRSRTLIWNLIQKILVEDISSTQTTLLLSLPW
jgi:hypothetical protein